MRSSQQTQMDTEGWFDTYPLSRTARDDLQGRGTHKPQRGPCFRCRVNSGALMAERHTRSIGSLSCERLHFLLTLQNETLRRTDGE